MSELNMHPVVDDYREVDVLPVSHDAEEIAHRWADASWSVRRPVNHPLNLDCAELLILMVARNSVEQLDPTTPTTPIHIDQRMAAVDRDPFLKLTPREWDLYDAYAARAHCIEGIFGVVRRELFEEPTVPAGSDPRRVRSLFSVAFKNLCLWGQENL